jgi:hypothetical protein
LVAVAYELSVICYQCAASSLVLASLPPTWLISLLALASSILVSTFLLLDLKSIGRNATLELLSFSTFLFQTLLIPLQLGHGKSL